MCKSCDEITIEVDGLIQSEHDGVISPTSNNNIIIDNNNNNNSNK